MAGKPHLLIVEDNLDHQEFFSDSLSPHYDMSFSVSPEECLSSLHERGVDLVILDYRLQEEFTGLDLLRTIALRYPSLPVIIVTAYGDEEVAAQAIRAGARDYVKKTLDHTYIKRIADDIRDILSAPPSSPAEEKADLIDFLSRHRAVFREDWRRKIEALKIKIDPRLEVAVDREDRESLFNAFLADLENESAVLCLAILKKIIWTGPFRAGSLLTAEILNTSLKETARDLILTRYRGPFDGPVRFMKRVGALIDENDLELSREYEKIVAESTDNLLRMERVSTKLLLMRTLQHEIRQPLTYIYNSIELLLAGEYRDSMPHMFSTILDQVKKIENLLYELEKDSETPVKDYSDKLPIFDVSPETGLSPDGTGPRAGGGLEGEP
ncbi:MAG: response regulator [Spirochaetales bacterium]|nr:response regulator [Spirochaetales bacterium]